MTRLGIGDALYATAVAFRRGGWPMALCLVLWIGVEFGNDVGQQLYDPFGRLFGVPAAQLADIDPGSAAGALRLAFIAKAGFHDLIACGFIAAMLRILLLGRLGPWGLGRDGFLRACAGVLLLNIAVAAITSGPPRLVNMVLSDMVMGNASALFAGALFVFFLLTGLFLSARLCLLFPSVALGRGLAVRRIWQTTSGNGLRLSFMILVTVLAYLFASGIFEVLLYPNYAFEGRPGLTALQAWFAVKDAVTGILALAFLLVLSAVAFARLTEFPAARIPGSGKTPKQLAEAFE